MALRPTQKIKSMTKYEIKHNSKAFTKALALMIFIALVTSAIVKTLLVLNYI